MCAGVASDSSGLLHRNEGLLCNLESGCHMVADTWTRSRGGFHTPVHQREILQQEEGGREREKEMTTLPIRGPNHSCTCGLTDTGDRS